MFLTTASVPYKRKTMSSVCVLVVDDDMAACMVLKRMVERLGWSCDIARNGVEAVAACSTNGYHVVFMDIFMPIKNGFEAALEIRNSSANENPHIIGMVSIDDLDIRRKCRDSGMADVLCKPISRIALQQSIVRFGIPEKVIDAKIHLLNQHENSIAISRDLASGISLNFTPIINNSPRSSPSHQQLSQLLQMYWVAMEARRNMNAGRQCQKPPAPSLRNEAA